VNSTTMAGKPTSSGCCVIWVSLSNPRNGHQPEILPISRRRCCGASSTSSTEFAQCTALDPRFSARWVTQRFVRKGPKRLQRSFGPLLNAGPVPKRPISAWSAFIRTVAIHCRCTNHCADHFQDPNCFTRSLALPSRSTKVLGSDRAASECVTKIERQSWKQPTAIKRKRSSTESSTGKSRRFRAGKANKKAVDWATSVALPNRPLRAREFRRSSSRI
jgi:hypothetical protein